MSSYLITVLILFASVHGKDFNGNQNTVEVDCKSAKVERAFKSNGVVPDLIPKAPDCLATVEFPSGAEARLGNELTPTQVTKIPKVTWNFDPKLFYTVAMVDPDVPSRDLRVAGQFKHWLVGNVPGERVCDGDTLAQYIGSTPPPLTGLHRYTILVYEQDSVQDFDVIPIIDTSTLGRPLFNITKFAQGNKLRGPVAGNFYQAQFDNIIPTLGILKL